MASIRKRGSRWQVQVRRLGSALTRTFVSKDDALRWAREQERAADNGGMAPQVARENCLTFLSEILDRYGRVVSPRKRSPSDRYHLRALTQSLGAVPIARLSPSHLTAYRDRRLTEVAAATVAKEMSLLMQALSVAVQEWDAPVEIEKLKLVRKPSPPPGRTRRLEAGDQVKLATALSACHNPYVKLAFEFGLATGMRRGEILGLKWRNIDRGRQTAFLSHTKNGSSRHVPLSLDAIKILDALAALRLDPEDRTSCPLEGLVFSLTASALQQAWRRAKKRAGVNDLRFHDLRHEAVSSFFEMGLSVPEVALITGHKDPRMLFRYTQLRAENVAKKLRATS